MGTASGKVLGRYEIVAEVGRGAMGAVYKARDPKIDRFVAIKTILLHESGVQGQREFRERFFVEARAAGRLLHPGIVAVFDVGEEPETGNPYIVMEYIEGPTLAKLLAEKARKLPLDDALRIAMEVAEALDYAHTQGVVHRDIKPANILITKEGQAKIGDFGVAQLDLTQLTLPGHALGTPAYMSPEQLEGQHVDGRSDLFSLGTILYSAVTGFNPFQGSSAASVCFKVANREPLQATALAPELPPELDAVISRALAKDPNERYQRGMELAQDIGELRKRAGARKSTIWFSPPEGNQRWLDGATKHVGLSSHPALDSSKLTSPPRVAASLLQIFSLARVEAGAAIALFLGAIVLSFFALRQIRMPSSASPPVVVSRASGLEDTFEKRSGTGSEAGAESRSDVPAQVQTDTDGVVVAPVVSAVPKAEAPPVVRKTSASPAGRKPPAAEVAKTGATAGPKAGTPGAPKPGARAAAVPATGGAVAQPNHDAAHETAAAPSIADSNVEIRVENRFSNATLAIWIDDKFAYEHPLHEGHKKRLLLLGGTKETVTIPVSAGKHALRVQVRADAEQYDETETVAGEFPKGGETILSVNFEKHTKKMRVALDHVQN